MIRRKLRVPPLSSQLVPRPRLEDRLASLVEAHPVLAVSATAGAGKTTAVARAVATMPDRDLAWLSVDRSDVAPGRLVAYLEAALAQPLPRVAGVAAGALAAGLSHPEAAGMLAEAVGDAPLVLVLDDLERLAGDEGAWAVLDALARYAPPTLRLVLISRRDVPQALLAGSAIPAALGEHDLAFTVAEAAAALVAVGHHGVDPGAAVEATGGWVTGVLFEAWRSSHHATGLGGEADPLHGYLAAHIMGRLAPAETDFLVRTSLLEEVSAPRAEALGLADAALRLAALRELHLPVSWSPDGRVLRCHSRLREYLLAQLDRRPTEESRALRLAHARLLAREGLDEEATEAFLREDAGADALETAERAIITVIERLDLGVAERWLTALADQARADDSPLTAAELMLAVAREDYRRGLELADRLAALGRRESVARSSPRAAAMMAWCYLHAGRLDDVAMLLGVAAQDPTVEAVRYATRPLTATPDAGPPVPPPPTGGAVDALLLRACYHLGRLTELTEPPASRWIEALTGPWRIGALRASGQTARALELYDSARVTGVAAVGLHALVGPELLADAGRPAEARIALAEGRAIARRSGSLIFELFNGVAEAKLHLRLERDPAAARAVVTRLEDELGARRFPHVREMLDTWAGHAHLLEHDDAAALARLRRAVGGMLAGEHVLELPTAAVYLSEAEWRTGDEDRADGAADLALEGARRQGSRHLLLQALGEFPAVASRRIDAERDADSAWHELGRALVARDVSLGVRLRTLVELDEFGRVAIRVDGIDARPRIAKSHELLAFLALRHPAGVDREELLDALFDGRADASARAYLRQAIHQLRRVLPPGAGVVTESTRIRLGEALRVSTESGRVELALAEAVRLRGEERLEATVAAMAVLDRGPYLPGVDSAWADRRRRELADLAGAARYEAAELAFAAGRLGDAQRWGQAVVEDEPFREGAWRLVMRIAGALGDERGVIVAYRACERALDTLHIAPSPSTRQLLEQLRR